MLFPLKIAPEHIQPWTRAVQLSRDSCFLEPRSSGAMQEPEAGTTSTATDRRVARGRHETRLRDNEFNATTEAIAARPDAPVRLTSRLACQRLSETLVGRGHVKAPVRQWGQRRRGRRHFEWRGAGMSRFHRRPGAKPDCAVARVVGTGPRRGQRASCHRRVHQGTGSGQAGLSRLEYHCNRPPVISPDGFRRRKRSATHVERSSYSAGPG